MSELHGKRVAIFVADLYNDFEFWYPKFRMLEAGAEVVVAGDKAQAVSTSKYGVKVAADVAYADLDPARFDAVIVPGGYAPDLMRREPKALEFVRKLDEAGKVVAFICHAGWVPVSAGILKGRRATSVGSIKDDMVNAGALWEDAEVVVDKGLISSRKPDDLPAFCRAIVAALKA